jgi:predicted TIM-barrel fold metal-dependent hydrolase
MQAKPKVVVLEEHFEVPELSDGGQGRSSTYTAGVDDVAQKLADVGERRIKAMDAAGIDLQILSHSAPAAQNLDPESAVRLSRIANDALHRIVADKPDRFAGFAILPTPDPAASVKELERSVTELGFVGAMIHGLTHGEFIDAKKYWPIFAMAEELDVPIYIHPAPPHPAVMDAYYKEYPIMARAGWGFGVEAGTQAIRLILSGLFDAYPKLKIIVGHLGEGLPYSLWRCDDILSRALTKRRFREYFCEHFYITTSGNFSHPALLCAVMEMGVDRILFSVDYPFADNVIGRQFVDSAPLSREDKDKILSHNATKLLRLAL